jgi:hypothetical protein
MSSHSDPSRGAQQGATGRNNDFSRRGPLDRFLSARNDLTERQRNAVERLLRGDSDQDVAASLGVDRGTIFRWRKSTAFQRELDRQRRQIWEQSVARLQSMVQPALNILQKQLTSDDVKLQIRAATVLLRFATPSRLAPAAVSARSGGGVASADHPREFQDLMDYVNAPLPGQPGAPEEIDDLDDDDEEEA